MLKDLERQWTDWARRPRSARTVRQWAKAEPVLATVGPQDFEDRANRTDAVQGALIRLAQQGTSDAALTLLHQLYPGLANVQRRTWHRHRDLEVVPAIAMIMIMSYRGHDRHKVAANIILNTLNMVIRDTTRPAVVSNPTVTHHQDHRSVRSHANTKGFEEAVANRVDLDSAFARAVSRGANPLNGELAQLVWGSGYKMGEAGAQHGLNRKAVAARLKRLRPELQELLAAS